MTLSPAALSADAVALQSEVLSVYKKGIYAGRLRRRGSTVTFQYAPRYIASGGKPVSASLPIQQELLAVEPPPLVAGQHKAGDASRLPAFFAGLLPEGKRLEKLAGLLGVSQENEFAVLAVMGGDCIGDVQVLPKGVAPRLVPPLVNLAIDWSEVEFETVIRVAAEEDRVALPGVQSKASAGEPKRRTFSVDGDIPLSVAGSGYIVKFDNSGQPNVTENEAYLLSVYRETGGDAAEGRLIRDKNGRTALLVTRFDRSDAGDGNLIRHACEDAAQVMGVRPEDKYSLRIEDVVNALVAQCDDQQAARADAFQQVVFAYLTGNGDLHAKNMSIVEGSDGKMRIAPAYDVPSTVIYLTVNQPTTIEQRLEREGQKSTQRRSLDRLMALPMGLPESVQRPDPDSMIGKANLSRPALIRFGSAVGLAPEDAGAIIDKVTNVTRDLWTRPEYRALITTEGGGDKRRSDVTAVLANRQRLAIGENLGGHMTPAASARRGMGESRGGLV